MRLYSLAIIRNVFLLNHVFVFGLIFIDRFSRGFTISTMLARFSWLINVCIDLLLITSLYVFGGFISNFFSQHMRLGFYLGCIVHVIGFGTAMFLGSLGEEKGALKKTDKRVEKDRTESTSKGWVEAVHSVSFIMSFLGFTWLLFPALVLENESSGLPNFGLIMVGLIFFSLISGGYGHHFSSKSNAESLPLKFLARFIVLIFFITSESMIQTASSLMSEPIYRYAALFWTTVAYLPLRILLLDVKQKSVIDLLFALITYSALVVGLFTG